jgi:uncharacterized metal-binding protein
MPFCSVQCLACKEKSCKYSKRYTSQHLQTLGFFIRVCALLFMQERDRLEVAQEAKRQKLEEVPRALRRLYE